MNKILKYQELDLEVARLEGELGDNQDRKNAIKMQQLLKDYQSKLISLNKKAKELDDGYAKCKEVFNQMSSNLELINKNMSSIDEKKIDGYIEANEGVLGNLIKLEKRLLAAISECTNIQNEYANIMKGARTAKTNLEKYKADFAFFKQDTENKIAEKKKELEHKISEIEQSIQKQNERTLKLEEQKEYMKTREFTEDIARDKLGLVYPGEIVLRADP